MMPLPRLLLPFFVGMAAWLYGGGVLPFGVAYGALCILFSVFLVCQAWTTETYHYRWVDGCLICLSFFTGGYTLAYSHDQLTRPRHFSVYEDWDGYMRGRIKDPPRERANSFQLVLSIDFVGNDSLNQEVQGQLMLYLEKDSFSSRLRYGDQLIFPNRFEEVNPRQNPSAFNYKQFLSHRQVFHTAYLPSGSWKSTGVFRGNRMVYIALVVRNYAMAVFEKHHLSGQEFAVVSALLLGYRELLNEELQQSFASAGAMHILCVSGLHVGVIFMVLKFMLSFLTKLPGGRTLQLFLVVLAIWFYAAITGFSPSVLRASVMFTFVGFSHGLRRPTNIYNTLAGSAFVLAMAEPGIITRIGFQLSYLAVIGIVALQPVFYRWLTFKWVIADKAWSIVAVSLAAQLATAPLAMHYFNQFPNYFLLTNLIALPLATAAIYLGMLTLMLDPLPWLAGLTGKLLSCLVSLLHRSVHWIDQLPFSTTEGVYLSIPEVAMILAGTICFIRLFCFGRRTAFLWGLMVVAVLSVIWSHRNYRHGIQDHFVVYNVPGGSMVDFFSGRKLVTLVGGELAEDPGQASYHVSGHRIRRGVKQPSVFIHLENSDTLAGLERFHIQGDIIVFGRLQILLVGERWQEWPKTASGNQQNILPAPRDDRLGQGPSFNYLLVTGGDRLDAAALLADLSVQKLIIDRSCPPWEADRWEAACSEAGIPVWNVRKQGAYVHGKGLYQPGQDQGHNHRDQYRQDNAVE